jgi:hypothetical protein
MVIRVGGYLHIRQVINHSGQSTKIVDLAAGCGRVDSKTNLAAAGYAAELLDL